MQMKGLVIVQVFVPSSTLITMGANNSDINESGDDYIMFAFHPVESTQSLAVILK